MMSIAFSIIIPTYNSQATLANALQSIANQAFNDFEVLIIDGLSIDKTLEIAESFTTKISSLRVFSEKDNGIYDAMNKGMGLARGNWLFFMGSDDTFYEAKTLNNVNNILSRASANVVYGNVKIIGDTGWAKHKEIYAGEFDLFKLLNQNICHQAMFFNSKLVNDVGDFNIDYKKSSDWDYNLRCWSKQPFQYMDVIVANFYAGGFSSNSFDKKIAEDFVSNLLKYFSWNVFNPYLNNKKFIYYKKVQQLKKQNHPFLYKLESLKNRFIKKRFK